MAKAIKNKLWKDKLLLNPGLHTNSTSKKTKHKY